MTDTEKIAQMDDMNWKPAVSYWKMQYEQMKQKHDQLLLKYLALEADTKEAEVFIEDLLDSEGL